MSLFRSIPGFCPYEISESGQLRRNGVILSTPSMKNGYKRKYLKDLKKNILIHRMIALAWIPNPNNLPEVNHIDADKTNNSIENLEWCTRKQNAIHAYKAGLFPDQRGEAGPRAKLKEIDIKIIREAHSISFTQKQISTYLKCHQSTISLIVNRINWNNI